MRRGSDEDGYATLTAIVLCGAAALLCAGVLSVAAGEKRGEARAMARLQQDEALDTASLHFAVKVAAARDAYAARSSETVMLADGRQMVVALVAQSEAAKWPIDKLEAVAPDVLARAVRLSVGQLVAMAAPAGSHPPRNDCVRSLFSELGQADPAHDRPSATSALYVSSAKDGQVWRLRAVAGGRVEERRVRFLGDPKRLFATLSVENLSLGEIPACTVLTS